MPTCLGSGRNTTYRSAIPVDHLRRTGGTRRFELALEPNANPAGKAFQTAMFTQGIPLAAFEATDIDAECARLKSHGVAFTLEPTRTGPVTIAVFADTCGNLIQLYEPA